MGKPGWAVAIRGRDVSLEAELGRAVCRCLQQLGHPAQPVFDDDPAGMGAAVLLLLVNAANFPGYCRQLRRAGPRRPRVVVWQMDPLPPTDVPAEAEAAGVRAAAWARRLGLPQTTEGMPRWQKVATLVRLRKWAYQHCSSYGYRRAVRLMPTPVDASGPLDWTQVRAAMEAWRSLQDARREGWLDHLVVSTRQRQQFLAARGVEAPFVPVGGCEELGRNLGLKRDVEVLFLGRVKHGTRAARLERVASELRKTDTSIRIVTDDCDGPARTQLLNRTRVLLNLHNYPWSPAWIRFVMAALCGAAVVSEPCEDQEPFAAGVHYLAVPEDRLADTIRHLLQDEAARDRVTGAAAELCRGSLTMLRSAQMLCSLPGIEGP